jgi:hypothetical protein
MEAMVIIGLSFGPFVKGETHRLTMDTFIKYVNELEPIIRKRRDSLHSTVKAFLKDQRKILFASWNGEMLRLISAEREGNGRFKRKRISDKNEEKGPKRRAHDTFNFALLQQEPESDEESLDNV